MPVDVKIAADWKSRLSTQFAQPYFEHLIHFLKQEKLAGKTIFPPGPQIFAAFEHTPFDLLKVVIIGQDPYHGVGQAHGLCFSVNPGVAVPPSLQNIYKELLQDIPGYVTPVNGDLRKWADQGVLLLNATLTVEKDKAGSHQGKGWETFTDAVIQLISDQKEQVVFLLWGKFAQGKAALIDHTKHLILQAAHPSPFSAHNGFLGCKHFSQTNTYLLEKGIQPIEW